MEQEFGDRARALAETARDSGSCVLMEERETGKSQKAGSSPGADGPYAGVAGQTRFENVHLVRESGDCASVSVCRVVNVKTHPELRERALDGTLHRLDDGRELALSFVYHDPDARNFALVLPSALAHTELKEWSRLMASIADDTSCPVPAYVRDNTTVIGGLALRRFITITATASSSAPLKPEPAPLTEREQELLQREAELLEHERALARSTQELAARERQLHRREGQLATARVDLELREQELNERRLGGHVGADPLVDGARTPKDAAAVRVSETEVLSSNKFESVAGDVANKRAVEARRLQADKPDAKSSQLEPSVASAPRYESALGEAAGEARATRMSETRALSATAHEAGARQARAPRTAELLASASPGYVAVNGEAVGLRAEPHARTSLLYETAAAEALWPSGSEPHAVSFPPQQDDALPGVARAREGDQEAASGTAASEGVVSNRPPLPIQLRQRLPPPRLVPVPSPRVPQEGAGATSADSGAALTQSAVYERAVPEQPEAARQLPKFAPPAGFAKLPSGRMAASLLNDELRLFAHVDPASRDAFRQGLDLCVQYVELSAYPVLVISVLGQLPSEPDSPLTGAATRRQMHCVLDAYAPSDVRIVEQLARRFRAQVALYVGGTHWQTLTVASLREGVAQAICEKVAQLPRQRTEQPAVSVRDVLRAVEQAPPPLTHEDLPFGPSRRDASTTATVLASVEQLARWLQPEKLAEATLSYCTPHHVIDATMRRVLRAAVALGVALPDALMERAIEHRAARDLPSMIRAQLQGFKLRIEQGENDLDAIATRKNWERLLALAAQHHIHIEDATPVTPPLQRTSSLVASESVTLPAGSVTVAAPMRTRPGTSRKPRPFEHLSAPELRARLPMGQMSMERLEIIRELCERGHPSSIEIVFSSLHTLKPEELPGAVASVLAFGEAAGDGLLVALQSPAPAIRQLAALALGRLRLRRALLPLLKQLQLEASEIHPELARALGDFGSAAVRPLARVFAGGDLSERLIDALAHVANHGAAMEVERLENDAHALVAQAAREALARRSRIEWEDAAVRELRALGETQSTAQRSQAFYAELTKVAI